jgi:ribosomal protein S18 acetylase RimI-like enzyme
LLRVAPRHVYRDTLRVIEIRATRPADIESFRACFDAVARERRWLAHVEAPPLEEVRRFVRDGLARGMVQRLALDGARVVGWCDVAPQSLEGFRHGGDLGMGILDGYRERRLGARLLEAALAGARERGLARVALEVYASNSRALALYRRFGFAEEGMKRAARILDGRAEDIVCMALWLREPATLLPASVS